MLIVLSNVQRLTIECSKSELKHVYTMLEAENYKIVINGPKIEEGRVVKDVNQIIAEKVTSSKVV